MKAADQTHHGLLWFALVIPFWRFIFTWMAKLAILLLKGKKMDDKDLVSGKVGDKGAYDVAFKGGALVGEFDFSPAPGVVAKMQVALDAEIVLVAIKNAIPGHFDDAIIDAAIALLKGQSVQAAPSA